MNWKRITTTLLAMMLITAMLGACGQKYASPSASPAATNKAVLGGGTATSPSPSVSPSPTASASSAPAHKTYSEPPKMTIDTSKSYSAEFDTTKGKFTIELFAKDAPKTVNNFVFLANDHFYDGIIFHRIIKTFMIQTGDPLGTGMGGPGYKFDDELSKAHQYEPGIVAMANAGPNTNGSQFFICTGDDSKSLNQSPNYTIFGKVTDGMDTVQKIAATPVKVGSMGEMSTPTETVKINSIKIVVK